MLDVSEFSNIAHLEGISIDAIIRELAGTVLRILANCGNAELPAEKCWNAETRFINGIWPVLNEYADGTVALMSDMTSIERYAAIACVRRK